MKMCGAHWKKLREAIEARGLYGLVSKTGEQATDRVMAQVDEGTTKANFDPLMGANFAIWSNATSAAGLAIMAPNEDGSEKCPLCYLIANCPCGKPESCPFESWIDRAADDMKVEAAKLGLLGSG